MAIELLVKPEHGTVEALPRVIFRGYRFLFLVDGRGLDMFDRGSRVILQRQRAEGLRGNICVNGASAQGVKGRRPRKLPFCLKAVWITYSPSCGNVHGRMA